MWGIPAMRAKRDNADTKSWSVSLLHGRRPSQDLLRSRPRAVEFSPGHQIPERKYSLQSAERPWSAPQWSGNAIKCSAATSASREEWSPTLRSSDTGRDLGVSGLHQGRSGKRSLGHPMLFVDDRCLPNYRLRCAATPGSTRSILSFGG